MGDTKRYVVEIQKNFMDSLYRTFMGSLYTLIIIEILRAYFILIFVWLK
ncbi:MAG: hypothetical protein Pg6B_08690 [Candidatus Azobacteroides pseudotrichonymphae]|jgi:hypothetical protein|nr:MAG: hypothetical protein Pg6B_08690 [Candidatus Azobacteroides pseudotrichonymphae]